MNTILFPHSFDIAHSAEAKWSRRPLFEVVVKTFCLNKQWFLSTKKETEAAVVIGVAN